MKKTGLRQMILSILGGMMCSVNVMGCYPLVPAYFAALYLEEVSLVMLFGFSYIGMFLFMPLSVGVKYAVALLIIAGAIRLILWANEGCPAYLAGIVSAVITVILSVSAGLLEWKEQPQAQAVFLEGVFVFAAVILLNRLVHEVLEWKPAQPNRYHIPRRQREQKLQGYAESFQGLSRIFWSMSTVKEQYTQEELGQAQSELTGKICGSCDACALCRKQENENISEILAGLISSVWENGVPDGKNREKLLEHCKRGDDMIEEAVHVFERVNLNRAWYNRLMENRQVIAEQLDAMAYIMQDCAKQERLLNESKRRELAEIRYRAKEHGIVVEEMQLVETTGGQLRLSAVLYSRMGGCIAGKVFLAEVSDILKCQMRLASDTKIFISKEPTVFFLCEDTKYRNVQGIARQKKDGAQISGDNFSFLELEQGELLLGLSDGMGSGSAACRESEMVLDLMERFLLSGFSAETAIRMMNSAMVMKGENDLYSTMDLCKINLYNGVASFYKIGAAATFIKHAGIVECIHAENLPVGAATQLELEVFEKKLEDGDFVIMVTDGVLEYLHVPKPEETMQEIIESIQTNNPGILAKRIMERVMLFTGGKVQDDMTVLAACIWEKP